jgi:hypothetical protein
MNSLLYDSPHLLITYIDNKDEAIEYFKKHLEMEPLQSLVIGILFYKDADMRFHDIIGCEVVKARRIVSGTTLIFQNDLDNMLHSITLAKKEEDERPKVETKTDY